MARNAVLTPPRFPRRLGRFDAIVKELARRVNRATMLALPGVTMPPRLVQAALPGAPASLPVRLAVQCTGPNGAATAELQLGDAAKFFPTDAALASWTAQADQGQAMIVYDAPGAQA